MGPGITGFRLAMGSALGFLPSSNAWNGAANLWAEGKLRSVKFRVTDKHGRVFPVFLARPHRIEIPELLTYPFARALLAKLRLLRGARTGTKAGKAGAP